MTKPMSNPPADTSIKVNKFRFENDFFEVAVVEEKPSQLTEQEREQAYMEGLTVGRQQMQQEVAKQLAAHTQTFQKAVASAQHQQAQWLASLSHQALTLLRQALMQLIGDAAIHYPADILSKHLSQVIQQLTHGEELVLRLHPDALAFHEKLAEKSTEIQGYLFLLKPDPTVAPGDCVVEWQSGGLEAKLAHAHQQLDSALAGLRLDGSTPPPESTEG
ncbi:MAG: FliH/SctL family protein [Alphaproteobacteria bacterium]